ncbi:A/G-specific adenine glycosylase [Asticcacaulis solisilvae]|uniref:A/G-specific adenine glycosylase n=1 Tax=Asticcacaulis solisilvae TaxID=1217274 RepID=UPI003FD7AC58
MTAIIEKDKGLVSRLRADLLEWYDRHKRDLPWRRGARDPYRVWLSEIMLQQTTTAHAAPYYSRFLELWPAVTDLAAAPDEQVMAEWAGLGYYSRARNLIKCARAVVADHGGRFPDTEAGLLSLPGLGAYTAAAVAAIAFDKPANVIDGNIERVMARLYALETPLPEGKALVRQAAQQWVSAERAGDWPQALMDLSAAVCRPKTPQCLLCPLREGCSGYASGNPEKYPVKAAKTAKPRRHGIAFLIVGEGGFIAERRADKGLLGGMLGVPHTPWRDASWTAAEADPPLPGFRPVGHYEHVFTHFALEQAVWKRDATAAEIADLLRRHNDWQLVPFDHQKALPTVFRKALKFL